jgi:hypothetical protein
VTNFKKKGEGEPRSEKAAGKMKAMKKMEEGSGKGRNRWKKT